MKNSERSAKQFWARITLVSLPFVALLAFGVSRWVHSAAKLAVADVRRKKFIEVIEIHGQVKALHSQMLNAPPSAGDLQILKIAPDGATVKKGDVLVEFDASTLRQKHAQDRSALRAAEAEIEQSRAAGRLKQEQDLTDVSKTSFDAQSAAMDAGKAEILSSIEGAEAKLTLVDAERKHAEAETKLQAHHVSTDAALIAKQQKRDQGAFDVTQDERALGSLTLRAPTDGIVVIQKNWRSGGQTGGSAPFKAGDRAWPGAAVIELPDPKVFRIEARVDEADRGRLRVGQAATVRVDAVGDHNFTGKIEEISPTASMDFNSTWPFSRNFTVILSIDSSESHLNTGMGATARIAVDEASNAIVIPVAAIFRKAGRTVVYIRSSDGFREVPVEVTRRSGDDALITNGLSVGEQVALKDPTATE